MTSFAAELTWACHAAQISLSEVQKELLAQFCTFLVQENQKVNLTALIDPRDVAVKHVADSLLCYQEKVFFPAAKIIDIGTGAGFPGIPLKIQYPDLDVTLLDALQKRVHFLTQAIELLNLQGIKAVHGRAEETARSGIYREHYDVAVSRAVARLDVLLEYGLPFIRVGGYFVAMKGPKYQQEIDEAQKALQILHAEVENVKKFTLPGTDDLRAVIYVRKMAPTPEKYPRRPGIPEKKPLQ